MGTLITPTVIARPAELLDRAIGWRCGVAAAVNAVGRTPADPVISQYAAVLGPVDDGSPAGGAALDSEPARRAAIGELLERYASARCRLPMVDRRDVPARQRILGHDDFTLHSRGQRGRSDFPLGDSYRRPQLTRVHSMIDNRPVWVPANLVGTDSGLGHLSTSNGLAAGPTTLQALLRAVQELVERDALMITWLHQIAARRVPIPQNVAEIADSIGADVTVFDLTPAYSPHPVAMIAGTAPAAGRPRNTVGLACRATFEEAVGKALLEWAQGIAFAGVRGGDGLETADVPTGFDEHAVFYTRHPQLWRQLPIWDGPVAEPPHTAPRGDHRDELADLVHGLDRHGIELLYRDLTTVDLAGCGVRAARALSPQLVPIHADHRWPHLGGTADDLGRRYPWAEPVGAFPSRYPHPLG